MDPSQRFGAMVRAVRVRRGWRQIDVAGRARLHRSVVSSIERGHLDHVTFGTFVRVARALDIKVSITARWRAGDLVRLVSGRHSQLHEAVSRWFAVTLPDWILAPEVSFAVYAERGVIDIVAWHPGRRALLIIELKTDVVDVNEVIGRMDQRRRLARRIVRERGWDPLAVSTWVLIARGRTNEARVRAHRSVLRRAFPADGRAIRRWLRDPDGSIDALSLWAVSLDGQPPRDLAARHRVHPGQRVRPPGATARAQGAGAHPAPRA